MAENTDYFAASYWGGGYWGGGYFGSGTAVIPPAIPTGGVFTFPRGRPKRRFNPALLQLIKEYLELKLSD